jgi:hypothetical protein
MSSGLAESGGFETQTPKQERHLQAVPDALAGSVEELEGSLNQANQTIISACRYLGRRILDNSEMAVLDHYETVLAASPYSVRENIAWHSERFQKLSQPAMFSIFDRLFNDVSGDVRSAMATSTESRIDSFKDEHRAGIYYMIDNLTYPVQQ